MQNMVIEVKNLYDAYQCSVPNKYSPQKEVLCEYCNHTFAMPQFRSFAVCPFCTRKLEMIYNGKREEQILYEAKIKLKIYLHIITVEILYSSFAFDDKRVFFTKTEKGKEVFRFDFQRKTSTYCKTTASDRGEVRQIVCTEISDKNYAAISKISCLRFLKNSLREKDFALRDLAKKLRENVRKFLSEREKRNVESLYVNEGYTAYGKLLQLLFNVHHRLNNPFAGNLTSYDLVDLSKDKNQIGVYSLPAWVDGGREKVKTINQIVLAGRDYISAYCEVLGLEGKPFIRKAISKNKNAAVLFTVACEVFTNYDYVRAAFHALDSMDFYGMEAKGFLEKVRKLKTCFSPYLTEKRILSLLVNWTKYMTNDCIRLFEQLDENSKDKLKKAAKNLRGKELHDWLSYRIKKQHHVHRVFNISSEMLERMNQTVNGCKFFIAQESEELLYAGFALNNCVVGYVEAVCKNKKQIALVKDEEKNSLIACIEIRQNAIHQAKIYNNIPVCVDEKVNTAVVAWSKQANLEIATSDVRVAA